MDDDLILAPRATPILVTSPAASWIEWTDHRAKVIGQVATPFDEPDHPCGQWTGRLSWLTEHDGVAVLSLEFLVADFELEPGTKLGFFIGRRCIADLTVDPSALSTPSTFLTRSPAPFFAPLTGRTSGIEPVFSLTYKRAKSVRGEPAPEPVPEKVFIAPDVTCCECGGEVSLDEGGATGVCLECGVKLTVKADGAG